MNAWLLDNAEEARASFRIALAAFGDRAEALLREKRPGVALSGAVPAELYCAVADPAGRAAAERWLADRATPAVLTVLVVPEASGLSDADICLGLSFDEHGMDRLLCLLDALQRLTAETGVVCVEPDDLRFALGAGGEGWLADVAASGPGRARQAVDALLSELRTQGLAAGAGGRAVLLVLGDIVEDAGALDTITAAVQNWMGPEALPVLGLRQSGEPGRLRLLALMTARPAA